MRGTIQRGAVVVLAVLSTACGNSAPTSPTATPPRPITAIDGAPTATPQPPPTLIRFPSPVGPSRTFIFDRQLSYPVRDFTTHSRVVLYDNGAFELRYPPSQYGSGVYRGAYQDAHGVLMFLFEFQGRPVGTPWDDASGTLAGDSLTVEYHELMRHADFENAVYVRLP